MNTIWKPLVGLVAATALMAACGSSKSAAPGNSVTASEKEWNISADHNIVKAGDVNFSVSNNGTINHELLVIKSDLPLGAFPMRSDNKFNEDDPTSKNVGESGEYEVGKTKTFTAKLDPGHYQLVCNIPGHYVKGMHIAFTVVA